jgi:hypothetical protein
LRIAALSANAGHHDRHTKATPTPHDPQVTVVGRPWNFSIAPRHTIPDRQKPVSKRERWVLADEWQSHSQASQARAAIGAARKSLRNRTRGHGNILLIIVLIKVQNIDLLFVAPYHPPTFAHARVNPNAARKG